VNKTTKKQRPTVLTSPEYIKNKQELEEGKAEREKGKIEGGPQTSSMDKKKLP
jgi:hypothetical protein